MNLILGVVAGGLLFPVLIFIGTATRLSAARREQRFAAMRLVGATPRQISMVAAVEAATAAVAGTAVGFGLFYAFRDPLASIRSPACRSSPTTCRWAC
ncbi:FtsX-like permease family protein [Micromonospora sp. M12]